MSVVKDEKMHRTKMKTNPPVHHTRRDLVDELISLVVQNSGEPAHLAPVRILRLALLLHVIVPEVHHADLPRLINVRVGGDELKKHDVILIAHTNDKKKLTTWNFL